MIAVRIGPDIRFAVVAIRSYFEKRAIQQTPQDLINHNCINLRLPTYGGTYRQSSPAFALVVDAIRYRA
jgi:hypothetical protein